MFNIETAAGKVGVFARLVPTSSGAWKAYTVFTSLETLAGGKVCFSLISHSQCVNYISCRSGGSQPSSTPRKALDRASSA